MTFLTYSLLALSIPRSFIKQIHRHKIYKKALAFSREIGLG
ncbi:hypothetical protein ESCAB7627_2277 [Escherichia albertii TW07627]|uniref:Uncharacterized protein n=1 Tax=Escherichia albertii (strain TW07627) TaxID=502347 RepID=A0ABC9NJ62_ESCAT|nr:hypothetical protein ESCAB7627_2277 [Escherichia albertii TW07627]